VRLVSETEARRIAVRSQLLDGSATDVLDTVRRLGFLQLDPIATVAPPQHLVLWGRHRDYDTAELDRLLWQERKLFEWNAFVWPIEDLPFVRALMRRWRRSTHYAHERWVREFVAENRAFRQYVVRELERHGPLLSRELEDRATGDPTNHRWYGTRRVGRMLSALHLRGEVAITGRSGGQRLWDLAERWYPETQPVTLRATEQFLAAKRFRALGVRRADAGWEAHPDAASGDVPVPDRVTFLSPFDRLVYDRDRAEALFGFRYRLEMYVPAAKRRYGYYVLPILHGDRLVGRVEPVVDRKSHVLRVVGLWDEPGAPAEAGPGIAESLRGLAAWLGADAVVWDCAPPRRWADAVGT